MENRYAAHPNEVKTYDTARLREEFLMEQLFAKDELVTVYSHVDRYIVGTAVTQSKDITLEVNLKDIGTDFFLERREIGIINVGGQGTVTADGEAYEIEPKNASTSVKALRKWYSRAMAQSRRLSSTLFLHQLTIPIQR